MEQNFSTEQFIEELHVLEKNACAILAQAIQSKDDQKYYYAEHYYDCLGMNILNLVQQDPFDTFTRWQNTDKRTEDLRGVIMQYQLGRGLLESFKYTGSAPITSEPASLHAIVEAVERTTPNRYFLLQAGELGRQGRYEEVFDAVQYIRERFTPFQVSNH